MKKILFILLLFIFIPTIYAGSAPIVRIGGKVYDSLEGAIENATEDDVITLISDVNLTNSLKINKVVNIDLNNNTIVAPEKVFEIKDGFLTLSGSGVVKEEKPNYGAIMLIGSTSPSNSNYSSVKVGKDVTLEGWSGIFINQNNSKAYGVNVYLDGNINSINDTSGAPGAGIYVNGNIKNKENSPVINISDGAKIKSTGTGLYIAGYSNFYIGDATIEGNTSGIGIKSGKLNINGATIICTGKDLTPTEGSNNGVKASGTTIQIESNNNYTGNIEIDISKGNFISKNSNVIYEYLGKGNTSQIYSISISGGNFESGKNKDVFLFTYSFNTVHSGFISGGEYSTNPSEYLKQGYTIVSVDGLYEVVKSTMKEVNMSGVSSNLEFFKCLIILIFLLTLSVTIYLKKQKRY